MKHAFTAASQVKLSALALPALARTKDSVYDSLGTNIGPPVADALRLTSLMAMLAFGSAAAAAKVRARVARKTNRVSTTPPRAGGNAKGASSGPRGRAVRCC